MSRNIEPDPFVNFITRAQELGLENTPIRRFYAKYPGFVEEIKLDDRGLVRVCVGELMEKPVSVWAFPDTFAGNGYGLYLPPQVGDPVWVTFHNGDPTQPRYSGGWWLAPSDAPGSGDSYVPADFKNPGSAPTTRGLVVPSGFGWLFEDQAGRDQRFEVWTGLMSDPRSPITKHHQFLMSDEPGNERIECLSFKGHKIRMVDIDGLEKVEIETQGGHKILLDDTPGQTKVEVTTPLGHSVVMDDIEQSIEATTPQQRKLALSDAIQRAAIETPTQAVEILDTAQTINITTPGAVNVAAGGAASVTAGGLATIQGAGVAINSGGGQALMQGAGTAAMNFDGAMVQRILSLDVISNAIKLGDTAGAVALVTEAFIALFNAHVHSGPGTPPLTPAVVGTHTTVKTKAS